MGEIVFTYDEYKTFQVSSNIFLIQRENIYEFQAGKTNFLQL